MDEDEDEGGEGYVEVDDLADDSQVPEGAPRQDLVNGDAHGA